MTIISIIIFLFVIICVISLYNRGISLRNFVREAFSTMDVYLKKRWDLIPNLVETVKGYASHEKGLLEEITSLRNQNYTNLSPDEKMELNNKLSLGLSRLIAVAENYPDLKASSNFSELQTQLSQIEDEIANSIALATGTLRIGTTSTSLNGILCEMIEKFSLKYPGVSYEIMTSSNDEIISLLKRGIIDVATLTTPFHPHPDIKTIKSIEIKSILVASPKYADLKNKEITPQMLEKYPFITLSRNMQLREYIEEIFASLNMHIKPKIEIDVATLIIPLLESGLGLSILPRILVDEEIKQGKLIELKPGFDIPDRTINIVYSESYLQTRVTRAFIKEISE